MKNSKKNSRQQNNKNNFDDPLIDSAYTDLILSETEDPFNNLHSTKTVHWSIAWSDLMMTMFILFAVLYIYKSAGREFFSKNQIEVDQSIHQKNDLKLGDKNQVIKTVVQKKAKPVIRAKTLDTVNKIDLVEDKTSRIILPGDLLFDLGKAEIKPQAQQALSEIASILRVNQYYINVVGHTDNTPIHSEQFSTNWELSAIRACRVARYLIEEMKIPGWRFYVSAYSYYYPIKSNSTPGNRASNRRVEILISKVKPYANIGSIQEIQLD